MSAPLPAPASPRTVDEPMAFTAEELASGVLRGTTIFAVAAPILAIAVTSVLDPDSASLMIPVLLLVWLVVIVPATLVAGLVFAPVARAVGRALRREPRRWPHLASFGGLGACASLAAGAVVGALLWAPTGDPLAGMAYTIPIAALFAPVAAASTAVGWYLEMRRALRADRGALEKAGGDRLEPGGDPQAQPRA